MNRASNFEAQMAEKAKIVDGYIEELFEKMILPQSPAMHNLRDSMKYSATNGGKRFRPVLSLLVAEALQFDFKEILPFAAAVEFIHTYSLIHDDLPCMDDDDVRRGKPTNHRVYGEATALLAGDALLTESFLLIAQAYEKKPALARQLIELLAQAAGLRGMVGGQAIDLAAEAAGEELERAQLEQMHLLKTGCLIQVSVDGASLIAGADLERAQHLRNFGRDLGLAFQVADDLLDADEEGQQSRSFVPFLGIEGVKKYLQEISEQALASLQKAKIPEGNLAALIEYNRSRKL